MRRTINFPALLASGVLTLLAACSSDSGGGDSDYKESDAGREYVKDVHILGEDGLVQVAGWARQPHFIWDRDRVPQERRVRIREWDYYGVTTPDFAISMTLAKVGFEEVGVGALASLNILDFHTGENLFKSLTQFDADEFLQFAPGAYGIYRLTFATGTLDYTMDGPTRVIDFVSGDPEQNPSTYMTAHIELDAPPGESMHLVTPFEDPGFFFYEFKAPDLLARGTVTFGEREYVLEEGAAWGVMDLVRAVIPHEMFWTWGYGGGRINGKVSGINLGSVFGDETYGTPDCVILDGKLHKFARVEWDYDVEHAADPWRFESSADGVDLSLTATNGFVEAGVTDLGFYRSEIHKPYGPWMGTVTLEDGSQLSVEGLWGGSEQVVTSW